MIPYGVRKRRISAFISIFSWRSAPIVSFILETSQSRRFTSEARDSDYWFPAELAVVGASVSGAYSSRSFVTFSPVTLLWYFEHLMICPQRAVPALVKEPTWRHYGFGHSTSGCKFGHSFSNLSICAFPVSVVTVTEGIR